MFALAPLDQSGRPNTPLEVLGPSQQFYSFEALVDTGFTGFIQLPAAAGALLGLSAGPDFLDVTLGNGVAVPAQLAQGTVRLARRTRQGPILLMPGPAGVVIGMDALRVFGLSLLVPPHRDAALIDANALRRFLQQKTGS